MKALASHPIENLEEKPLAFFPLESPADESTSLPSTREFCTEKHQSFLSMENYANVESHGGVL